MQERLSCSIKNQGFSLIEMAVVLLLIGLIVGGISIGRNITTSQRQNTIIMEVEQYQQGILAFKEKYRALPGDFVAAASRWSGSTNGNGDGIITTSTEGFRAWNHLSKSRILSDMNVSFPSGNIVVGTNVPSSRAVDGGGFQIAGGVTVYTQNLGNVLLFGRTNTTELTAGAVSPRTARALEEKMDKNVSPDKGSVLTVRSQTLSSGCADKAYNGASPVTLNFGDKTESCYMVFRLSQDNF